MWIAYTLYVPFAAYLYLLSLCPFHCTLKDVDRNNNEVLLKGMFCTSPVPAINHIYHNKLKSSASNEVSQTSGIETW